MAYELYRQWRYALSYSALNYLQAGASLALTLLLAQVLAVSVFAEYRLGVTVLSIVSVAGLYGADKGLLIDLVHRKNEALTVVAYGVVRIIVAILSALSVVAYILLTADEAQAIWISVIFGTAGVLMALRSQGWFDYRHRLRQHAAILLADRFLLVLIAGGAILLWGDDIGAISLGAITLIAIVTTLGIEFGILSRAVRLSPARAPLVGEATGILRRYSWVWLLALSNMLMTSIGQMVLYARGGENELAYLGLALQFAAISRLFIQQVVRLNGAAIAVATEETRDRLRLRRHMRESIRVVAAGGLVLFLVVGGVGTVVLSNLFDQKYVPAIPIVWVLGGWIIVLGIGLNINRYIIGLGLQRAVFFTSLGWGSISVVLTFSLAPEFGALGYAWSLLGCHAGSVLTQYVLFRWSK